MGNKEELQELEDQVAKGLEEAYRKMILFKKSVNSLVVIEKNGKVVKVKPEDMAPTIKYKK